MQKRLEKITRNMDIFVTDTRALSKQAEADQHDMPGIDMLNKYIYQRGGKILSTALLVLK